MRYTVEISCDEFIDALYFVIKKQKKVNLITACMILSVGTASLIANWWKHRNDSIFPILITACVLILIVMIVCGIPFLTITRRMRKLYKPQNHLPHEVEFTEQSFSVYSEGSTAITAWTKFQSWKETEKGFFIYWAEDENSFIPKRIFNTAEEEQALRGYLTQALGPAK